jgi:preprotein translocase subunit Sec63
MAQLKLSMYKENLFEYFRFKRKKKNVLNGLLTITSNLEKADSSEKQKQLVQHLIEIKEKLVS